MSLAKFDNIDIPYLHSQVVKREFIGDRVRLAGGMMHQDYTDIKRTWKIETNYLTKSEADTIINYLNNKNWSAIEFWLDDFGDTSNTIRAYIDLVNEKRVNFLDGTVRNNGRSLTLEVIEK